MTTTTTNVTVDATDQLIKGWKEHSYEITGMIEVGGDFGGGTLTFGISLSGGSVVNPWDDKDGIQLSMTSAETVAFKIPVVIRRSDSLGIYYTMSGSTTPDVNITVVDNT